MSVFKVYFGYTKNICLYCRGITITYIHVCVYIYMYTFGPTLSVFGGMKWEP